MEFYLKRAKMSVEVLPSTPIKPTYTPIESAIPLGPTVSTATHKKKIWITDVTQSGLTVNFKLHAPNTTIANRFRKTIMGKVPTIAIDKVIIMNNTSFFQDEIVGQRLALIPFIYPKSGTYNNEIFLKVGPVDTFTRVFSSSLRGNIRPMADDICIIQLNKGQELDVKMSLAEGTGSQHAKWSPISNCVINVSQIKLGTSFDDYAYEYQMSDLNCANLAKIYPIQPDRPYQVFDVEIESIGCLDTKRLLETAIKLVNQ